MSRTREWIGLEVRALKARDIGLVRKNGSSLEGWEEEIWKGTCVWRRGEINL